MRRANREIFGKLLEYQEIVLATSSTTLGCDAIHPGFGFLSENATFARLVETCGIKFIGPSGDVIDCMGNKSAARKLMMENDVPVVPGSNGSVHTLEEARKAAEAIGYPVLIKASAGGGGAGDAQGVFARRVREGVFGGQK